MQIYIQRTSAWDCSIVRAEIVPGGREYRVHHADAGYSVWPVDQFENCHRLLTRHEAQLINQSVAELEVMSITDDGKPGDFNVLSGKLTLVDGQEV